MRMHIRRLQRPAMVCAVVRTQHSGPARVGSDHKLRSEKVALRLKRRLKQSRERVRRNLARYLRFSETAQIKTLYPFTTPDADYRSARNALACRSSGRSVSAFSQSFISCA